MDAAFVRLLVAAIALGVGVGFGFDRLGVLGLFGADQPERSATVIPWHRLEVTALRGIPREWKLPVVNLRDEVVILAAPHLEGCSACLTLTWEGASAKGEVSLEPGERTLLVVAYSGDASVRSKRFALRFDSRRASAPARPATEPRSTASVFTELHLRLLGQPLQLRPSPMRVSAKSREPLTFRVRGDVPYAPSSIDALDSDGPVHWAWRPPGWLDTHARLTLVPTRSWAGLRTGTLSLRAATSEQPRVATWRAAAVDPVRTRFRRSERSSQHVAQGAGARDTLAAASTGGAVDDVVEVAAAMACVVSLSRWSGTTRRDGAGSRIGVRHVLAPRDRLVVQPAAPIGIGESVAVATASGFEQVIRRKP